MTVTDIVVQTQPSALEWIAAGATAVSAVVIAWQAWQTRRSVQASEKAVDVAQAALTESQLARVENGVPRLIVTTAFYVGAEKLWRWEQGQTVEIEQGHIFKLPRDADMMLTCRHKFSIRNDGPGTVVPKFKASPSTSVMTATEPIPPGTEKEFVFTMRKSVAEWVSLLTPVPSEDERKVYPVSGTVDVIYSGPRDSDVDEIHPVIIRGSALVAVEDAEGDWRRYEDFEWQQSLTARVAPATRTYWRSRSANVKFDTQPIAQGEIAAS
ncbi:tetratricopeptide repeat protein [Microbacterium sp. 1.5R]|uniref:tetratricopeptide repeat protein n=1 Tax=Microbacterium sp. 1.5R TaxID=1916917 RepID=UPI0011A3B647|nr:tetratricopeptide repeat protein [Microbacterium sp. 1.5R]